MTITLCTVGPPIEIMPAPFDDTVILLPPETVMGPLDRVSGCPIDETAEPVVEIVIVESDELKPMPVPATKEPLIDDPFSVNPAPPAGEGPMMVIAGFVDSWLSVIFDPATSAKAVEDAVFAVPEVAPPAADVMVVSTLAPPPPALPINWIVPAPVEIVMFEPDSTTVPVDVARFDP